MGQLPKDCRALRQKQNPQLPTEQATCGAVPLRNDLYLSTYAHVTWLWERMELIFESLHISVLVDCNLQGLNTYTKRFDSSSTDMNRKPMTWRMNLNRWRRLHYRQFILLHACILNTASVATLSGGPVPKSGGKALSAVKADKAAKVAGWPVGGLYDHWYPGKSLENRQNSLLIL